jgi:hypothetical protein
MNQKTKSEMLSKEFLLARRNLLRAYHSLSNPSDPDRVGRARAQAMDAVHMLEIILGFRDKNGRSIHPDFD